MFVYIYSAAVCMYVCIYVCVCVCVCVCMCVCMCVCVYVCMCVCMCVCIYSAAICMYVCMYACVCMYVFVYVCVFVYIVQRCCTQTSREPLSTSQYLSPRCWSLWPRNKSLSKSLLTRVRTSGMPVSFTSMLVSLAPTYWSLLSLIRSLLSLY
jgi:hypothetical protein